MTDITYEKRIENLFGRHPSVQSAGFTAGAYKEGLDGMLSLDKALGSPWKQFRCIHVAGTNGKGSVSSMIAAALGGAGLKVALYTSPHISDFRERMRIIQSGTTSKLIPREDVLFFLDNFNDACENLSFFEITTGMAFWWFAKEKVDVAVIEVGLGGRLDSTNIIQPELSIVTSIGLDHCAMLGNSRSQIAAEKAGIFKNGTRAIVWGQDEQTEPVFRSIANEKGANLVFADESEGLFSASQEAELLAGMDLRGDYQAQNLHTVNVALAGLVSPDLKDYAADAIRHTAAITSLRGRWERLCQQPEVICDIGHNPPALEKNFAQLRSSGRPLHIVYGVMADKDLAGISHLMPAEAKYYLAAPAGERALPVERLWSKLSELRPELEMKSFGSVEEAVRAAVSAAQKQKNALVYIGGSTFVVAEAVTLFD